MLPPHEVHEVACFRIYPNIKNLAKNFIKGASFSENKKSVFKGIFKVIVQYSGLMIKWLTNVQLVYKVLWTVILCNDMWQKADKLRRDWIMVEGVGNKMAVQIAELAIINCNQL